MVVDDPVRPLITVKQAASRLSVSLAKFYQLLASGEIPSVKVGKSRRVDPRELEDFIGRNTRRDTSQ